MRRQGWQQPELRDENGTIIQPGPFGSKTMFTTAQNDGAFDYVLNDLCVLKDQVDGRIITVANKAALPAKGESGKAYLASDTGKEYTWDGTSWQEITSSVESLSAYDAKKAAKDAASSAAASLSLASDAKAAQTAAAASATAAKSSQDAAKQSADNCAEYYAKAQTASGKPYFYLDKAGNICISYELDTEATEG